MYLTIFCFILIISNLRFNILITISLEASTSSEMSMSILKNDGVSSKGSNNENSTLISEDSKMNNPNIRKKCYMDNKTNCNLSSGLQNSILANTNEDTFKRSVQSAGKFSTSDEINYVETQHKIKITADYFEGADFLLNASCASDMISKIYEHDETDDSTKICKDPNVNTFGNDTSMSKSVYDDKTSFQTKDSNVESKKRTRSIESIFPSTSQRPNPVLNGATGNVFVGSEDKKNDIYEGITSEKFYEEVQFLSSHLPDPVLIRKLFLEENTRRYCNMAFFNDYNFLEKDIISNYFILPPLNNKTDQDEVLQYKIEFNSFFKIDEPLETMDSHESKCGLNRSLEMKIQVLTLLFKEFPDFIRRLMEDDKILTKPNLVKLVRDFIKSLKTSTKLLKDGEINKEEIENSTIARYIIKGCRKTRLDNFYNFLNFTKLFLGACRVHIYENEIDEKKKGDLIRDYIDRNLVKFDETDRKYYYIISWINLESFNIIKNIEESLGVKNPNPGKKQRTN